MITAGFIGLGLIGGSIAKTLRKVHPDSKIIAYNRRREVLEAAVKDKVVDVPLDGITDEFAKCDIVFLCVPVELNNEYLAALKGVVTKDTIITDVGSVKTSIHKTARQLGIEEYFIGGHPMAGSEKMGYIAASDTLLENAYYAITPTPYTTDEKLDYYTNLVKDIGAIPLVVDPDKHDYAVAGISHLPHLIASGLVNLVKDNDTADELMKRLAAGGFKDITRIASSSGDMWSQICMTNTDQISSMLGKYIDYLTEIKKMVDGRDKQGISDMFASSKEYRDSISLLTKGPMEKDYSIFVYLEDKEGALSRVTSILSNEHVSIKNVEIIHNREYRNGALYLSFYSEEAYDVARDALLVSGYTIY